MLWELERQSTANAVNATGSLALVRGPTFEEYGFREFGVPDVFDNAGDGIPLRAPKLLIESDRNRRDGGKVIHLKCADLFRK